MLCLLLNLFFLLLKYTALSLNSIRLWHKSEYRGKNLGEDKKKKKKTLAL